MSKPETKFEPIAPVAAPSQVITTDALQLLIASAVRSELANIMTSKSPDQRMVEEMARARGSDRPAAQEYLVKCHSPISGATFTARLIESRSLGTRVVELLDYERPKGWDVKKVDGGIVPDGDEMPMRNQDGSTSKKYTMWLYKEFWLKDSNAIGGKPLPPQWRADYATPEGAVVLTKEQLAKLGITAEQITQAVGDNAADAKVTADKAAE